MHVWNVLHAACWKYRTQTLRKNSHLCTTTQLCRAISSQLRHVSTVGNKPVKQQYLLQMSLQYGVLRTTSGWDLLASCGTPAHFKFSTGFASWQCYCMVVQQWASAKLCGVKQRATPIFGRGPSRWALAPISSFYFFCGSVRVSRVRVQHCIVLQFRVSL